MPELEEEFSRLLPLVSTPGQYVGGEINSVYKENIPHRLALGFADTYAVGMSNHGLRILYSIVNDMPEWAAERVYVPEVEFEKLLRRDGLPLCTLESRTALKDCTAITVSMQYELSATGLLTMLDLGGIPLTRFERGEDCPLVIAGGHAVFNPEPFSDFFDILFVGEGEEGLPEILNIIAEYQGKVSRRDLISKIAVDVRGAYAPGLYDVQEAEGFAVVRESEDLPYPVRKRIVQDFENISVPLKPVVPVVETVHERVVLEVMRGCPNGCRFCQAGNACRPVRSRPVGKLVEEAAQCYRHTGYDEIGLLSLSTSDYPEFDDLVSKLDEKFAPLGVSMSLPSLRVDDSLFEIPKRFKTVRKSGLTIAPEAGTERLRAVINKDVTNENLMRSVREAFRQGWKSVKLYFMVGLPTETDEDVIAIAHLANEAARLRPKGKGKGKALTCSVSNFVPKPFTPFQWAKMDSPDEFQRKQDLIAANIDRRIVDYKGHDPRVSFLEGVISRADRGVGKVMLAAWQKGARLEAWSDHFRPDLWNEAFAECGLDANLYACSPRSEGSLLPWSHIDCGVSGAFLLRELQKSREGVNTKRCSKENCNGCGVEGCRFAVKA